MNIQETIAKLKDQVVINEKLVEESKKTVTACKAKIKKLETIMRNASAILKDEEQPAEAAEIND